MCYGMYRWLTSRAARGGIASVNIDFQDSADMHGALLLDAMLPVLAGMLRLDAEKSLPLDITLKGE